MKLTPLLTPALMIASLVLMSRTPWAAVPFVAAVLLEGVTRWIDRDRIGTLAKVTADLKALSDRVGSIEFSRGMQG